MIYDKTLKLIVDLLHVKDAAILSRYDGLLWFEKSTIKSSKERFSIKVDGLLEDIILEKKAKIINSKQLGNDRLLKSLNYPSFLYLFPCLDSQQDLSALLLLSLGKSSDFDPDRFSLIHVVGQRLAVELEKNRVSKEKDDLSQFNQAVLHSIGEVSWDYSSKKEQFIWQGPVDKVFGFDKNSMPKNIHSLMELIHPSHRGEIEDRFYMNENTDDQFEIDFQYQLNGVYQWLRMTGVKPLVTETSSDRVIGTVKNVHKEKRSERDRISAMVRAKDSERKRIASDIHDSLGQGLSVARLQLDMLLEMDVPDNVKAHVTNISTLVKGAIDESRAISHDLMPPALADYGLIEALQTLVNQANQLSSIDIKFFESDIEERFDEEMETNIYRICQEGVNNILKHSEASEALIQVIQHPDYLFIGIEDNGVGLPPTLENRGLGLRNMENRVATLGGKLDFESNNGLIISIEIIL